MPKKLQKEQYLVLNALDATGAALPICAFKSVAAKAPGTADTQACNAWAENVVQALEAQGFVTRLAPISDKGPGFEITTEGRAALAVDPITVKRQGLTAAMVSRMCQTAQAQETGRPQEVHYDRATYKALEGRGIVTIETQPGGVQLVRLTDDGKDVCELMMDRMLSFPPEAQADAELEAQD